MKYEDTYFLNAQEAFKVASLQNKSDDGYILQLCYYEGEAIESDLVNLIHLPLETFGDDLINGRYRIPSKLDFSGLELSPEVKLDVQLHFNMTIEQAKALRHELNHKYYETLKNAKPDFNEPLRFYLTANSNTRVMQHITQNIVNALLKSNIEVLFDLYYGIEDSGSLKKLSEFNPHATININHLNNSFLNDNVFNFVWLQDNFSIEQFKKIKKLRDRDYIFHLVKALNKHLHLYNINSQYQGFCIDTKVYKENEDIQRKNKIVMIGTSYKEGFDAVKHPKKDEIVKILLDNYITGVVNTTWKTHLQFCSLMTYYNIKEVELGAIVRYVERDGFLLYIASMQMDYELEIYGWGWEEYTQLKNNFKGILSYGKDISKVYNSAKYTLVLGGYALQQRTLEAASSGCIPLVYDSRHNEEGSEDQNCFEESLLFFKTPDDILSLLNKEHNLDLNCIVKANSYETFTNKMLTIINNQK